MEDDPDKIDESEPPFAVSPVSATPQIPDFLKHPKVADTAVAGAAEAPTPSDGGAVNALADNEAKKRTASASAARDPARQPAVGVLRVI